MDSSDEAKPPTAAKECVKVAVNIRPLISNELLLGCTDCITVVPGLPQVQIGSHAFTYDHVYGGSATPSSAIFEECVAPLVDALFHGYNATVLAYGQTGSGKTYTMGTNYNGEDSCGGIIPQVVQTIFRKVDRLKETTEFLVRVSFIEIFKEEVYDLLDPNANASLRAEAGSSLAKTAIPSRVPIQIRETTTGGITLAGVTEAEVRSKEEMASYLTRGSLARATGSTNMNSQSSRSHAIFTILMEQKKTSNGAINTELSDDILSAKLHLVDLAGSERAKRTGADGLRFKEGVHINRGLLALGNVISALGDEKRRKEGGHVPYRDSKLTRLLQDSLGGNSKTAMIACISPADTNAEETINTLKYANRARNIQNKAVVNRDPVAVEMQRLRSQVEQLQSEVLYCRGNGAPSEELQVLRHKITLLEASNAELHQELKECQTNCERLGQHALDAQVEKDGLILKIELARNGKSWDELDKTDKLPELDLVKGYVSKIQDLEAELLRVQNLSNPGRNLFMDCLVLEKDADIHNMHDIASGSDGKIEEDEKEREHSSLQDRLDKELQELDKRLEQKEAEMKGFGTVDLMHHYEKKLLDLEHEKKALQKEIEELRFHLSNKQSSSEDGAQKLTEEKLNMLESQLSELKKKQEGQAQLLRQRQKSEEASKRLQEEIQRIKSQKVQLQHKIKQESEQFRAWKASREKEVLQLKKEGRRNEYEMHKLLALNQRQKMVVQRKTEEAAMATKRLKEVMEARKPSRDLSGFRNANGPVVQALLQAIEHELEVRVNEHEVRSAYERQLELRAAMGKELGRLKEEAEKSKQKCLSDCPQAMSPSARNSRISALETMLSTSSSTLISMASQLSEAQERDRVVSGKGRWNQVRSLGEAKTIMNELFNLASSSRCQLRDKEVSCRELDSENSELKEKCLRLSSILKQKEAHLAEIREENLKKSMAAAESSYFGDDGRPYGLRKVPRASMALNQSRNNMDLLEDMDTSDSEVSDSEYEPEHDVAEADMLESAKKMSKRRYKSIAVAKPKVEVNNPKPETVIEEANSNPEKSESGVCCSCSRVSSCKTKKCECRAAGGTCSSSCGCVASKCANRADGFIRKSIDEAHLSDNVEEEKSMSLVSQGTMLLQSALTEGLATENPEAPSRKPLSDIGNTKVNSKIPKPSRRKNWRKSSIQLVPTETLPSMQDNSGATPRATVDVPLRLPRVMDSMSTGSHPPPLVDRNSGISDEVAGGNKEGGRGLARAKSPLHLRTVSDDKENHRL